MTTRSAARARLLDPTPRAAGRGAGAGRGPGPAPGRLERRSSDEDPRRPRRRTTAGAPTGESAATAPTARRKEEAQEEADPDRAAAGRADRPLREQRHRGHPVVTERPAAATSRSPSTCAPGPAARLHLDGVPDTLTCPSPPARPDLVEPRVPGGIATQDVVVRQAVDTPIGIVWNANRSDEDCSALAGWAGPATTTSRRPPSVASRPTSSSSWSGPRAR